MPKQISGLKSSDFRPLRINMRLFPLFFGNLIWLIYALIIIQNSNFDTHFLPIISFIKNFVAENVAKSAADQCRVVVGCFIPREQSNNHILHKKKQSLSFHCN
jgi:hypothetical protein